MAYAADGWLMGARGGGTVERRLRKLGLGWHTLRDVVHDDEHLKIDHLVIGRPGAFVVSSYWLDEPARLRGRERVKRSNNVSSICAHAARAVSRRLTRVSGEEIAAWPVIVSNGLTLDVRMESDGVYVVAEQLLVPWLKSLVPVHDPQTVEAVAFHARKSATWLPRS